MCKTTQKSLMIDCLLKVLLEERGVTFELIEFLLEVSSHKKLKEINRKSLTLFIPKTVFPAMNWIKTRRGPKKIGRANENKRNELGANKRWCDENPCLLDWDYQGFPSNEINSRGLRKVHIRLQCVRISSDEAEPPVNNFGTWLARI